MRQLASIQKIEWLNPIEGKDRIELAGVLGWQIIVQKGEYQVGDLTIFCEPDSVFQDKPEFEFLRSKKFRIRTMKLGSVLSQGICFQPSMLPKGNYNIGDDVTELMGITQYEATQDKDPAPKAIKPPKNPVLKFLYRFSIFRKLFMSRKEQRKSFPEFVSKSDETRLQNIPHILENKDIKYELHEKLDGTSLTVGLKRIKRNKFDFSVCSRNLRLFDDDGSVYWKVAKKYNLNDVLLNLIGDKEFVSIQGEILAPNIQGNKYKVKEPILRAFNLIYPSGRVDSIDGEKILSKYGIEWVPLITKDFVLLDTVNEMLALADGKSALVDDLKEGFVARNYEKNISFKCVSPEFLIKWKE